jgi:uncharacterized membrane protein
MMNTQRLNSFTDGVVAIIITIMVLSLPVPRSPGMAALLPLSVLFAAYALSFIKVGSTGRSTTTCCRSRARSTGGCCSPICSISSG